ncbi:hypothetical protein EVAR_91343_1 [Eumeta japonica]|uniref:Nesprin-1 n=1 Tax=Eumeta variegata TaxID=151549 RepID=A0A4C1SK00_EUMVA|nr:hypothetical protein EVAR_91343_1 [Eumeta japonica]
MIKLIEDQLAHLRQLLLLREQFIALINEIIAFIMKYTDVIIDIKMLPDSLEEKITKYDDVVVKIQECEGVLASATDKGKNCLKKNGCRIVRNFDWLHNNEGSVKSRPLLDRDPDSVEHELQKHHKLSQEVKAYLDKFNKISSGIKSEVEHKIFFGNEQPVRNLVHKQIQDAADKIWPSLNNYEQTELSAELSNMQTKLTNCLAQAKTQQGELEREYERWREYKQSVERVKATIDRSKFCDEQVQNLAGVHFNIQSCRMQLEIYNLSARLYAADISLMPQLVSRLENLLLLTQSQTSDITLANQQAQGLQRQSDARNRQLIEQENIELNRLWKELINSLEQRRDNLQTVADKWDDFENKLLGWEKSLGRLLDKFRNVDPVVRSRRHLEDTKHAIQEILSESEELKSSHKDIEALSKSIVTFLREVHQSSAEAIQAKLDNLVKQQNE